MNRTPSVAKMIHLLIGERAKVIAWANSSAADAPHILDCHRDQARREIEAEVLANPRCKVSP